jgi:hypothetical protein
MVLVGRQEGSTPLQKLTKSTRSFGYLDKGIGLSVNGSVSFPLLSPII